MKKMTPSSFSSEQQSSDTQEEKYPVNIIQEEINEESGPAKPGQLFTGKK